jgi:hypothetical protein
VALKVDGARALSSRVSFAHSRFSGRRGEGAAAFVAFAARQRICDKIMTAGKATAS